MKDLGVKQRRIYDMMNIMEECGCQIAIKGEVLVARNSII